jgi:hypothetical protein
MDDYSLLMASYDTMYGNYLHSVGYIPTVRLLKAAAEISATAGEHSLDSERRGRFLEKPGRRPASEPWPTTIR